MREVLIALSALTIMSCASKEIVLRPQGALAEISLTDGNVRSGELLTLQDSILLCAADTLTGIPLDHIQSLRLNIDESRGWVAQVILVQGLPSVVALAVEDARWIGAIGLGVTALTWLAFEFSGPRVTYEQPWKREDVESLQLHMRYPHGLNDEQISRLKQSLAGKKY